MLTPSYAVALFTSILKGQGYSVDLFDCTNYAPAVEFFQEPLTVTRANKMPGNSRKFDADALFGVPKQDMLGDFVKAIENFKPHAVIFSTLVEDTWPQARSMLEVLSDYQQVESIIGGVFVTMAPSVVLGDPHVQCIGLGEGEETIVEFCECVRKGISPKKVKSTWVKNEAGQIIRNSYRPLTDVNKVMPDFSLFDERRFYRPLGARIWKTYPIESIRGCPYSCKFCNSSTQVSIARTNNQGNFVRRKKVAALEREIISLIERYNAEFLYFNDDGFMARPKHEVIEFVEAYRKIKLPFWLQTRFEDVDAEKLQLLSEVGCYRISFGLEHGNERFRWEHLGRKNTNESILKKARAVTQAGIPYTLNSIVGFPFETRELFFDTVRLNREIGDFDSMSVNIFVPYHGTELREIAIREGWLDPNRLTTSVIGESILEMPSPFLSSTEISSLQRVMPLYVGMPEARYPEIERAQIADHEGNRIFKKLSDDFYEMKYGTDETDRMLTYSG